MTTNQFTSPIGKFGYYHPETKSTLFTNGPGFPVRCIDTRRHWWYGISYAVRPIFGKNDQAIWTPWFKPEINEDNLAELKAVWDRFNV